MRYKLSIILLLIIFNLNSHAQVQAPDYTQFISNLPVYNPAFVGADDYLTLSSGFRQGWNKFANSKSFYTSAYGALGAFKSENFRKNSLHLSNNDIYSDIPLKLRRKHGIGGLIDYSELESFQSLRVNLNYSYHLPLTKKLSLSMGTAVGFSDQRIDFTNLSVRDPENDDFYQRLISASGGGQQSLLVDIGFALYSDNLFVAVNASSIVENVFNPDDNLSEILNESKYSFLLGKQFDLNAFVQIQPLVRVDYNSINEVDYLLGVRAMYRNRISAGLHYQHDKRLSAILGLTISTNFRIGYSYDYYLQGLNSFNKGNHEISLKLALFNRFTIRPKIW